jgi:DNA invertase Pin-like site-specific DNA recombinase
MIHLVETIGELRERGVGFQSLSDGVIDTTSPSGELVFMIFSALAQFERRLIQERTNAGLTAARARGRFGGRPKLTASHPKVRAAIEMHRTSLSVSEICRSLGISRASLYRYLKLAPNNQPGVSDSRP